MEIIDASPHPIPEPVKRDFPALQMDKPWYLTVTKNGITDWKTEASIVMFNSGLLCRKFGLAIYLEKNYFKNQNYYYSTVSWERSDYNDIFKISHEFNYYTRCEKSSLHGRLMDSLEDAKSECVKLMWDSFYK